MAVTVIKSGNAYDSSKYKEIMIDSDADLADIPEGTCAPGSVAYTCETGGTALEEMYMWNGEEWVEM